MALSSADDIAQAISDELATLDPDGYGALSSDDQDAIRTKLLTAIATVIRDELTSNASVSFSAGEITGTDSNGDTHSTLTASGGSIT